jgi:FKBP-type peptidyl-prolyl cis-trans isomerase
LNQVIKGWTEGFLILKREEWDSLVPAHLGYGSRGSIPGGAVLILILN